jgi:hypothetical protein
VDVCGRVRYIFGSQWEKFVVNMIKDERGKQENTRRPVLPSITSPKPRHPHRLENVITTSLLNGENKKVCVISSFFVIYNRGNILISYPHLTHTNSKILQPIGGGEEGHEQPIGGEGPVAIKGANTPATIP